MDVFRTSDAHWDFFSNSFCDNIFYIEKDNAGNNISEPYSEPWKTSKVGHFAKIVNNL